MNFYYYEIIRKTSGKTDVIDLTPEIEAKLKLSGIKNGYVLLFIPGSTASLTTIEFESGVVEDLKQAIERLIPSNIPYAHNLRWGDGNGFSHVRASFFGPDLMIPIKDGELLLGTWQQIILIDFDNRKRERKIVVQIAGE